MVDQAFVDNQIVAYNKDRACTHKSTLCHAPSRAMYFGRDGVVSACCSSRSAAYGKWPLKSVDELWFGNQSRLQMASALSGNKLPSGCERCADQLIAGSFASLQASKFDALITPTTSRKDPEYPTRIDFELSNKCNLECVMCSGFSRPASVPIARTFPRFPPRMTRHLLSS